MITLIAVITPLGLPLGVVAALFGLGLLGCVVGMVVLGRKGRGQ